MNVLVIGASRGIGLELARQYLRDGAHVIATYRREDAGEKLRGLGADAFALDVHDGERIAALRQHIRVPLLDVAILCAGVYGPRSAAIEPPGNKDFDAVMHTNVRGAMHLLVALAPLMSSPGGKIAALSSKMGSIEQMRSTNGWLYRASKAALNACIKAASIELGQRGVTVFALHPGWVRTDMGGDGAEIDVETSVTGLRGRIAAAGADANGRFFNYDGEALPW